MSHNTVMCDITGHMISEWVMKGILAPKPLALSDKLKDNFNQLAHSSIMKLNHDAMDKVGKCYTANSQLKLPHLYAFSKNDQN